MPEGEYVIIRITPDPARNEAANVGVLAWDDRSHFLAFDNEAIHRVMSVNRRMHPDAFLGLEEVIRDHLGLVDDPPGHELRERLAEQPGLPISWTPPRYTLIPPSPSGLADTVGEIMDRIVHPHVRSGRASGDMFDQLERRLRPLVQSGDVVRDHLFKATRTGVERSVDFYANSHRNIAIDHLKLAYQDARNIRLHADAQAHKVVDILGRNDLRVVVLAAFSDEDAHRPANDDARSILRDSKAEVVDSVDEIAALFD